MTKTLRISKVLTLIAFCSIAGVWFLRSETLAMFLFPDSTLFSSKYSEDYFDSIQRGERIEEVLAHLGNPLRVVREDGGSGATFFFSAPGSESQNWRMRYINVRNAIVESVHAGYYVD